MLFNVLSQTQTASEIWRSWNGSKRSFSSWTVGRSSQRWRLMCFFLRFYSNLTWAVSLLAKQKKRWLSRNGTFSLSFHTFRVFSLLSVGEKSFSDATWRPLPVYWSFQPSRTEANVREMTGTAALCTDRNSADDEPTPPQRSPAQLMEAQHRSLNRRISAAGSCCERCSSLGSRTCFHGPAPGLRRSSLGRSQWGTSKRRIYVEVRLRKNLPKPKEIQILTFYHNRFHQGQLWSQIKEQPWIWL